VRAAVKDRVRIVKRDPTGLGDHQQHTFEVFIDLIVPKSDDTPAARLQPNCSPIIPGLG
jgi:hypothetical protein